MLDNEAVHETLDGLDRPEAPRKKIFITDLTPRDGQQCKLATRAHTDDLLPLCEQMDQIGFYAVEVWGGATYDVCLRYLREDPWERLRRIKGVMPRTKLQMLFRGQSVVGYRPRSDRVLRKFIEKSIEHGISVFRVFDSLNDTRNMELAIRTIQEAGGEVHGEISYTESPVHTFDKWMSCAREIAALEPDWIALKDATGILMPHQVFRIIQGLKQVTAGKIPILLHNHDMSGTAIMNHLMAILAGVDMLDTVLSPLAFGSSHPATESIVAALRGTRYETGLDLGALVQASEIVKKIRAKYRAYETEYAGVNAKVLTHKIPGGMISNMVAQLAEMDAVDRVDEALDEVPRVEADLGYPPLLTPSSQIVGVQAVLNVIAGERYRTITREVREYVGGKYGRPPGPIAPELVAKIVGPGQSTDFSRRPGDLADPEEWDKAVAEIGELARSDEDVLLYVVFPAQAREFLDLRSRGKLHRAPVAEMVDPAKKSKGTAPVEFDVLYHGEKFRSKVEGVSMHVEPGQPRKYYIRIDGRLEEIQLIPYRETDASGMELSGSGESGQMPRASLPGDVTVPMQGLVVRVLVEEGDEVEQGQTLALVEAMKMESEIQAPIAGVVKKIFVTAGDQAKPDYALMRIQA